MRVGRMGTGLPNRVRCRAVGWKQRVGDVQIDGMGSCTNRRDGELFCVGGDGKLGLGSSEVYSTRCLNWLANIPVSYAHRPNILLCQSCNWKKQ